MTDLISINDAVRDGISKLRMDNWANAEDHIELYLIEGLEAGPWVKLWSPANEICGNENPHRIMITMLGDYDAKCWRPYNP